MTLSSDQKSSHWLQLYGSDVYRWNKLSQDGKTVWYRRQGIVEGMFDVDGNDYEGRADLSIFFEVKYKTKLDEEQLHQRIILIWACLRTMRPLMSGKSLYRTDFLSDSNGRRWLDKCFLCGPPQSLSEALSKSEESLSFVENVVNVDDFYLHAMNTARAFDAKQSLARLFVLPSEQGTRDTDTLRFLIVAGHQIADGLTVFRWVNHFIEIMNQTPAQIQNTIQTLCSDSQKFEARLPPAQETLYPPVATRPALSRWKWLITRILRHVKKSPGPAFANPLMREKPLQTADAMPPVYDGVLNYDRKPPNNSFSIATDLSMRATHNLIRLAREAKISIGSGAFTLVGIVMMRLEEQRQPNMSLADRLPFRGSFPLNPRPFLAGPSTTGKEDSIMLAFSEGVTIPFLPAHCDLRRSFRVLGRLVHRQLGQYQKRRRTAEEEIRLGLQSPSQLLPSLYLMTMERLDGMSKPDQRVGFNPQGLYPTGQKFQRATCGISSVGDRTGLISSGRHDVDELRDSDLSADFVRMQTNVRSREQEFLVGASGTKDVLGFSVSYDGNYIDPEKARQWQSLIHSILDYDMGIPEDSPPLVTGQSKL